MAFHPYPQVIPQVFNPGGFGPPRGLTRASTCPWVDHSASGLQHATQRPIQTRFRYGCPSRVNLATYRNSQAHSSKGTRSLHSSRNWIAPTACRHTVSGTISRPLTGVLFTFPSRYWFTIGHQGVFRLRGWSPQIHTGFLGPRATWDPARKSLRFHLRGCHPLCRRFPERLRLLGRFLTSCQISSSGQVLPLPLSRNACRLSHVTSLACSAFAHHYSRNRFCFLFLRVLRCFTSPRYRNLPYAFRQERRPATTAGFPHSDILGSQSGCRLPEAYRRLQRPSSAPGAKASTVRP